MGPGIVMVANYWTEARYISIPGDLITLPTMNMEDMIKSLATSVTMFINQTKDNLLRVQTEIRNLKTTVDTLANEMKADWEAQKKGAATTSRKLNQTVTGIRDQVAAAVMSDAVEANVTSDVHLCLKEPPKL